MPIICAFIESQYIAREDYLGKGYLEEGCLGKGYLEEDFQCPKGGFGVNASQSVSHPE